MCEEYTLSVLLNWPLQSVRYVRNVPQKVCSIANISRCRLLHISHPQQATETWFEILSSGGLTYLPRYFLNIFRFLPLCSVFTSSHRLMFTFFYSQGSPYVYLHFIFVWCNQQTYTTTEFVSVFYFQLSTRVCSLNFKAYMMLNAICNCLCAG